MPDHSSNSSQKDAEPENVVNTPHRPNIILVMAGLITFIALLITGAANISLPEWLSHVLTSITVVVIVHLIDRYFTFGEFRRELEKLNQSVKQDINKETKSSMARLEHKIPEIVRGPMSEELAHTNASLTAMIQSDILRIYSSRSETCDAISKAIKEPSSTEIRLMGISLNDFIREEETKLGKAWEYLTKLATKAQEDKEEEDHKSIMIRILIIDPNCLGAQLRSISESQGKLTMVGRLDSDVRNAIDGIENLQKVARNKSVNFECRIYRLPPIMFLCHVNSRCYVQQYHFWTARLKGTPIPILEYGAH